MADPFVSKKSKPTCDTCGQLFTPTAGNNGRCPSCQQAIEEGLSAVAARTLSLEAIAEFQSAKVDGQPWWEAGRLLFVAAYPDLDALNLEAPLAAAAGYSITSISATDGHSNLGRTAVGFWLAGPLGAAAAHSRTTGTIIVAWALSPPVASGRADNT